MSQVYDILILVGTIVLVFVIVAWGVRFGSALVSDSLLSTPTLVQLSVASYASALCTFSGDANVSYQLIKPYPLEILFNSTNVWAKPTDTKYYPFTDTTRGGYIGFGIKPPAEWVNCMPVQEKISRLHVGIEDTVNTFKTGDRLSISVK